MVMFWAMTEKRKDLDNATRPIRGSATWKRKLKRKLYHKFRLTWVADIILDPLRKQ